MVDKTNLDELQKTVIYGFTILDDEHVLDIKKVSDNFKEVEKILGNKADLGGGKDSTFTEAIKSNSDKIAKMLEIELEDYSVEKNGEKNIPNYFKFIWEKLNSIELTDLKVKITTWQDNTLDKVLKTLKDWIGDLSNLETNEKNSTVGAINEVFDITTNLKTADNLLNNQLNAINSKITTNNVEFDRLNREFRQLNGGE